MATFLPDEVYVGQSAEYYRTLSELVHEYHKVVEACVPRDVFEKTLPTGCPCIECLWVRSEVEGVLRDRA